MKQSTLKLLVWLYHHPQPLAVKRQLPKIMTALKPSGLKSLLFTAKRNFLINQEWIDGVETVLLSSHGVEAVESLFPSLTQKDGTDSHEQLLVFLSAPSRDQGFRYLRSQLNKHKAICLTRGVFYFPYEMPLELNVLLKQLYVGSAIVWEIGQWKFGDKHSVIGQKTDAASMNSLYSGISTELDRLIEKIESNKIAKDQTNTEISSLFDRFFGVLQTDNSHSTASIREARSGKDILLRLQNLL